MYIKNIIHIILFIIYEKGMFYILYIWYVYTYI